MCPYPSVASTIIRVYEIRVRSTRGTALRTGATSVGKGRKQLGGGRLLALPACTVMRAPVIGDSCVTRLAVVAGMRRTRPVATSSSACRSIWFLGTTATRHGVTARSVAVRRPSRSSANSPRIAPGPTSVTGLPSTSTRSTPSNSRNRSSPWSPCSTRFRPAWSRRNCGLASITATDSWRSKDDSTAVTIGAESSSPQGVCTPNASRHQVS